MRFCRFPTSERRFDEIKSGGEKYGRNRNALSILDSEQSVHIWAVQHSYKRAVQCLLSLRRPLLIADPPSRLLHDLSCFYDLADSYPNL